MGIKLLFAMTMVGAITVARAEPAQNTDTSQILEAFRKKYDLPALFVVVVKDGKICDRAAVGIRKIGNTTPVTTNDVIHIGSCTKSMTATLAATFIDQGRLRWDTTIGEVFPELKGKMNKQYEPVTIEQLLTHRGGVPNRPPPDAIKRAWEAQGVPVDLRPEFLAHFGTFHFFDKPQGNPTEQRRAFIEAVLAQSPETAPGTKWMYSNQGYAIVGAMLEKISGQSWEQLMIDRLFKPLHMDTAGFGAPGTYGKVDQPWGHRTEHGIVRAFHYDNPPAIAPGGNVHCSLDDLARFAIMHLEGEKNGGLLKRETFRKLHTPPDGDSGSQWLPEGGEYACGWICMNRGWAGGRVLNHGGSNTMWKTVMWLAPEKDFAVVVSTNYSGADDISLKTEDECNEVANALIKKWLPD